MTFMTSPSVDGVTVGSSSTSVATYSEGRTLVALTNDSDEVIYLALGTTAEMNKGIRLNANGGTATLNRDEGCQLSINAICSSGSKNLAIQIV